MQSLEGLWKEAADDTFQLQNLKSEVPKGRDYRYKALQAQIVDGVSGANRVWWKLMDSWDPLSSFTGTFSSHLLSCAVWAQGVMQHPNMMTQRRPP